MLYIFFQLKFCGAQINNDLIKTGGRQKKKKQKLNNKSKDEKL